MDENTYIHRIKICLGHISSLGKVTRKTKSFQNISFKNIYFNEDVENNIKLYKKPRIIQILQK